VALLDGYRVILSVQQRDLEIHAPSLRLPPEQPSDGVAGTVDLAAHSRTFSPAYGLASILT
jgi:hypothetical protein